MDPGLDKERRELFRKSGGRVWNFEVEGSYGLQVWSGPFSVIDVYR